MAHSSFFIHSRLFTSISADMKPLLTRSGVQHASFYPHPHIQHNVGTQADMFLSCSTPTHPTEFSSSLSMEGTVTDLSDASYCLSQETVETGSGVVTGERSGCQRYCRKQNVFSVRIVTAYAAEKVLCLWSTC